MKPTERANPKPLRGIEGIKEGAAAFWRGFTELSALAFAAMTTTAVITLFGLGWFFTPAILSGPLGDYAARSARDAAAFATVEAVRLANHAQERPRLLFFGTSSIAQAYGDPKAIEKQLEDSNSLLDWDVHMLATPLQTKLDQLTLIETVLANRGAEDPPLVIAIGVGIHRLGNNDTKVFELEQMGRLGVRSDWADEALARTGTVPRRRSGVSVLENFRFVVSHAPVVLARLAVMRPARYNFASYAVGSPVPVAERYRDATKMRVESSRDDPEYLRFLTDLQTKVAQFPNVYLVLLDDRLSPSFLADYGFMTLSDTFYRTFDEYASRFGSVFIPAMQAAGLTADDYHDDYHIKIGKPQELVRRAFADHFLIFSEKIKAFE